jgi:AMP-polyphosphate phosphotransferase
MGKGRLEKVTHRHAPDNVDEIERNLQFRLFQILIAYHRQQRAAVIVLEGWDAAGKGGLIKRLSAELDPRFYEVVPISAPNELERRQHYMARFWAELPEAGNWTIFDRSWYGRVAVERVEGFASCEEWGRAYSEINAFESTLATDGARVVKLFLHVSQAEQDERLRERLELPWKRWKVGPDDFRNRAKRADYVEAYEEMFERTDTEHAPWHIIGANHKKQARIEGLKIIADRLAEGVDLSDPLLAPELRALAEKELGGELDPQ